MKKFPTLTVSGLQEVTNLVRSRSDFLFEINEQVADLWRTSDQRIGDSVEAQIAREQMALTEAQMYLQLRSVANILADQAIIIAGMAGQILANQRDQT